MERADRSNAGLTADWRVWFAKWLEVYGRASSRRPFSTSHHCTTSTSPSPPHFTPSATKPIEDVLCVSSTITTTQRVATTSVASCLCSDHRACDCRRRQFLTLHAHRNQATATALAIGVSKVQRDIYLFHTLPIREPH
jgi:hypothetical protein